MNKKIAKEIFNNLSESGKIKLAEEFQKLCIDYGIFLTNEEIAQVVPTFLKKSFSKSENVAEKTVTIKKAGRAKKTKTLDFYKYVSTDQTRYFMNGVYHEEGFKIATNGNVLVMAKFDYDSKFEKVILSKKLTQIKGQFPNYKKVIPDFSKMHKIYFDWQGAKNELKENSVIIKISKEFKECIYRLPNGSLCKIENVNRILHFMECYPDSEMYVFDDVKKCIAFICGTVENPEAMLLVMPLLTTADTGNTCNYGNLIFQKCTLTENSILISFNKLDILERKEYGTMTEKDTKFLNDIQKFLAIFQKENAA